MKLITLALMMTAMLQAGAQQHFLVTRHQVVQALLQRGVVVEEEQVSLVASIVSSGPETVLDVDSMQAFGAARSKSPVQAKVKLVCPEPHACVPFYALVTLPNDEALTALPVVEHVVAVRVPSAPIAIRAGSSATLSVETAHMHLRVPVISLQDGSIGSRIRVSSPDRKQIYTATIVSATLLSGSL